MRFEDKIRDLRIKKHKGFETKAFLLDVSKLVEGEAFEYLMGEVDFCGTKIDLSRRPMIPRPETEFWVMQALDNIIKHRGSENQEFLVFHALDMFAGSGCVGIAILKNIINSTVDFVEIDPKLKKQIEISIVKNRIEEKRTHVASGDVFEDFSINTEKYDVIFAVPPYISQAMRFEVMQELHAEAELSFFDKEDGYYYHKQVLGRSGEFLKERGHLYLEFDFTQRECIEDLVREYNWEVEEFLKDPYGHDCAIILKRSHP